MLTIRPIETGDFVTLVKNTATDQNELTPSSWVIVDPDEGPVGHGTLEECKRQCDEFGDTYTVQEPEEQDAERWDGLS